MTAPPAIIDGKQLRISWSRLRAHAECRAFGALQAAGHRSPSSDIRLFFPGTVVDRAMRQWLGQEHPEPGWMVRHADRILDEEEVTARETGDGIVKWKSPSDKAEVREFCRDLVVRLEAVLTEVCLPYSWEAAVRFKVPIEVPWLDGSLRQILLTGETDLQVSYPGPVSALGVPCAGTGIYDLKATKNNDYWRKVEGQMSFYDVSWWGMNGVFPVVSALVQPMCEQQVLPFHFTEQSRRDLFNRICTTAMDIFRGDTPPKLPAAGCDWCSCRHACPKFTVPGGRGRVTMLGGVGVP